MNRRSLLAHLDARAWDLVIDLAASIDPGHAVQHRARTLVNDADQFNNRPLSYPKLAAGDADAAPWPPGSGAVPFAARNTMQDAIWRECIAPGDNEWTTWSDSVALAECAAHALERRGWTVTPRRSTPPGSDGLASGIEGCVQATAEMQLPGRSGRVMVTEYRLCPLTETDALDWQVWTVRVRRHRDDLWVVESMFQVLNQTGEWVHDPPSSDNQAAWEETHCFDQSSALRLAEQAQWTLQVNRKTAADILAQPTSTDPEPPT